MATGILGRKVGMTQIFDEAGNVIPVTVLEVGPCKVLQVKTVETDGYEALQLGFLDKPRRLASRSERGHVAALDSKRAKARANAGVEAGAKAGCEPQRFVREIRGNVGETKVGDSVLVSVFEGVVRVDVTSTSKGRGFAGVMKRHNYRGQRATHGVKKVHRLPGSIGNSQFPGHVVRGRRMAGHLGDARVTARNLRLVRIDAENNLLLVSGAVPGPNGGYVVVRQTNML
ncbi:MAG: 50S ribosomal protein L3 [Pirellulales bacterium]|nr:50S ribosomal protein L3 [Pirellulales bacterium]